ncbi:flagellar protein FliT [Rossellomorea marisflavi]|uniref:flagellar protein FliT n=1 Tax=Rossellomorea marisflavi TaxID=189381 RepID=UPI003D2A3E79
MSAVLECHGITKQLKALLEGEEDRDTKINTIDSLLVEREQLLPSITPPYSLEEQRMGREIVLWNKQIDQKLAGLKIDIKRDINGVSKTKTTVQRYTNPYESMQTDGMFYDKRN